MKRIVKVAGLALAAVAGMSVAYQAGLHMGPGARSVDAGGASVQPAADFDARLAALEAAVARHSGAPAASSGNPAASTPAGGTPFASAGERSLPAMDTSPQAVMRRDKQVIDTMDARFESNPEDPEWSVKTQGMINEVVLSDIPAAEGGRPSRYAARCKQAMCRISATFADEGEASAWSDLFLTAVSDAMPRTRLLMVRNPAGGIDVMVYGARAGHPDQINLR